MGYEEQNDDPSSLPVLCRTMKSVYKEMNRSDSENYASNYFKPKRVNQLLGVEPQL